MNGIVRWGYVPGVVTADAVARQLSSGHNRDGKVRLILDRDQLTDEGDLSKDAREQIAQVCPGELSFTTKTYGDDVISVTIIPEEGWSVPG